MASCKSTLQREEMRALQLFLSAEIHLGIEVSQSRALTLSNADESLLNGMVEVDRESRCDLHASSVPPLTLVSDFRQST